jgi:hypothetical protein
MYINISKHSVIYLYIYIGLQHIAELEEQLKPLSENLEGAKKKLYFPLSAITIGQVNMDIYIYVYICICIYV